MAITETIPFNFDEIYSYIEKKFTDKGYDVQEGSNTMQLVTAMSYLTSMLNANTAVNINETILSLARNRDMILRDARTLGYEIDHTQSYRYNLILNFTALETFSIKRYTSFSAGDYMYYYMGNQLEDFTVTDNTTTHYYAEISQIQSAVVGATWSTSLELALFPDLDGLAVDHPDVVSMKSTLNAYGTDLVQYFGVIKRLEVREGVLHKYTDPEHSTTLSKVIELESVVDNITGEITQRTQYYIDVPFQNVEENGLDVYLTYIDEEGQRHDKELWSRSPTFMIDKDTVLNQEYVRLDNIEFKMPRIYFKLGEIGKELRVGTFVFINALVSNGDKPAIVEVSSDFEASELNCVVLGHDLTLQGAAEESNDSIKQNAPLFHNTANRVITKPDYVAFSNRQAPIKFSDVWDGHDEWPQQPGHIWFSYVPSANIRAFAPLDALTNAEYRLLKATASDADKKNWFIEEGEVQDAWDFLNNYKIPTLKFHHRHPVYFDFDYEIEVIQYSVGSTRKDQHQALFDVINDYFRGKTSEVPVESFKFNYFNSNLTRRLDDELTDISGFNINLTNRISICDTNIIEEDVVDPDAPIQVYYQQIRFHLGLPFEKVIGEDGSINTNKLPNITTINFVGADTLSVDYNSEVVTNMTPTEELVTYDILLGATVIGQYRVFNTADPDIEVILYVQSDGGYTDGLTFADLTNVLYIDVAYPSPNIKFSRNTIPRLKSVKFI